MSPDLISNTDSKCRNGTLHAMRHAVVEVAAMMEDRLQRDGHGVPVTGINRSSRSGDRNNRVASFNDIIIVFFLLKECNFAPFLSSQNRRTGERCESVILTSDPAAACISPPLPDPAA